MKKIKIILILFLIFVMNSGNSQPVEQLYVVSPYEGAAISTGIEGGGLMIIDQGTGFVQSAIDLTHNGVVVDGANGMAVDPTDQTVYIVFKDGANFPSSRPLGTLNVTTGEITLVGDLGDDVAGIAFDVSGQMYAVTGDGADTSETLYTVNKSTAAMTEVVALGDGSDGESIAYNPANGLLYTRSGRDTNPSFYSIDPSNPVPNQIGIAGTALDETFGFVYDAANSRFLEVNLDNELVAIDPADGTQTLLSDYTNGGFFSGRYYRAPMFYTNTDLIFRNGFEENVFALPPVN
jgi:hypothetical protein